MKRWNDVQGRRDLIKLACLVSAIAGTLAIFAVTPSLSSPTLLSMMITSVLSPWVATLERRGWSRALSITFIFLILGVILGFAGFVGIQSGLNEWQSFKLRAPAEFQAAIAKLRNFEVEIQSRYPFLNSVHPTDKILTWGQETGQWFVYNGPTLMGEFLTWIFIVPPLTFVLLNEGRAIKRRFFQLVPNRFFESFFIITTHISTAISEYVQAKILEAVLLGSMVTIGLAIVKAPYAIVLGLAAGITNILPYLGPLIGAVPGILIVGFDGHPSTYLIPVVLVYVMFPLVVAKLVKLHPLILIAIVAVGQKYYGLIGMLISIPIATALKVVLQEVYTAVYEQKISHISYEPPPEIEALFRGP
jgi:putative permease